jgi:large subunit ribosomal protein L15
MALKNRKIRTKHRGTRNCGRGKKGSRKRGGSRGMGGTHKHMWTWVIHNEPDYFGAPSLTSLQKKAKAVNVGYLNQYAISRNVKEVDAGQLGYGKVLGGGEVTHPITVKAGSFSVKAKEKLEKAGGKALTG